MTIVSRIIFGVAGLTLSFIGLVIIWMAATAPVSIPAFIVVGAGTLGFMCVVIGLVIFVQAAIFGRAGI